MSVGGVTRERLRFANGESRNVTGVLTGRVRLDAGGGVISERVGLPRARAAATTTGGGGVGGAREPLVRAISGRPASEGPGPRRPRD